MTTSQHVNIQLQFSACSEVYMNMPFKLSQIWYGDVPLPMIGLSSCYADLSCNIIAIRNEVAVRRSMCSFFTNSKEPRRHRDTSNSEMGKVDLVLRCL